MMIKKEADICPVCGSYRIYSEFRWIEDTTVSVRCTCKECNESWNEYFCLLYDGYAYNGVAYDADGEEM